MKRAALYHSTELENLLGIISSGVIVGRSSAYINNKIHSGISFTRNSRLIIKRASDVRIVLDYDNLRSSGKLFPIHANNSEIVKRYIANIREKIDFDLRSRIDYSYNHLPKNKRNDIYITESGRAEFIQFRDQSSNTALKDIKSITKLLSSDFRSKYIQSDPNLEPWAEEFFIGNLDATKRNIHSIDIKINVSCHKLPAIQYWCDKNKIKLQILTCQST